MPLLLWRLSLLVSNLQRKTSPWTQIAIEGSPSPVLSKLFEFVFLERLRPIFDEYGTPHLNQAAY